MKKFLKHVFLLVSIISSAQEFKYEVFSTSINSKYAELGVTYINDQTVLFASSQKNENDKSFAKDRRKQNRQLHLELYLANILNNGDLVRVDEFNNETKNMFFESDVTFSPDQKTIYFTWNNFYNTEKLADSAKWKTLRIIKATIDSQYTISNLKQVPFNSENYSVRNPTISNDGKKLYFVSDMPGGYGETDIYMVDVLPNNMYGNPINLGSQINSKQAELYPFIDENNTLYFSSNGHNGMGGLDIYKSNFNFNSNIFEKREILPTPINSKYDDFAFVINSISNTGYITSNRPESVGDVDVFSFVFSKKECKQLLSYRIINSENNSLITDSNIAVYKNNKLVSANTNSLENFNPIQLECNSSYKIVFQKENFEPFEYFLKTNESADLKLEKTISLVPILCNQNLITFISDINTKDKLQNAEITLIDSSNLKTTRISNLNGISNIPVKCNSKYNLLVFLKNYEPYVKEIETTNSATINLEKNIELIPSVCNQELAITIINAQSNVKINNAQIIIQQNNQPEKLIKVNQNEVYTTTINCSKNYIIKVSAANFEPQEINISSSNINATILEKTISLKEIICKQELSVTVSDLISKQVINNAKITLVKNNNTSELKNSTENGTTSFSTNCETDYLLKVVAPNYEPQEVNFSTNKRTNSTLEKNIELIPVVCEQELVVTLFDAATKIKMVNTKVDLILNNATISSKESDSEGIVSFTINCDKTYELNASKEFFEPTNLTVIANNAAKNEKNVLLTKIKCEQSLTGRVIDSLTLQPINDLQLLLYKNNVLTAKLKSAKGAFEQNLDCETNYTLEVAKAGYKTKYIEFLTSNKSEIIKNQILLEPIEEFISVSNIKMIQTNPIYFDLDQSEITKIAAIELEKVVNILKNYPTMTIEVRSHTDSRATDSYNLKLSIDRSKAAMNYIISKGINASRISGKGFGETQLVNNCSNGVPCTTLEHEKNRRTEFVVIKN